MRKFIQNKLKEQKGLTLIELLAVIVILAIIAAIAIPAIGNIIDNSRVGTMKADNLNAIAAAELFLIDNPNEQTVELADIVGAAANPGSGTSGQPGYVAPTSAKPAYIDNAGSLKSFTYTVADKKVASRAQQGTMYMTIGSAAKTRVASSPNRSRAIENTITAGEGTLPAVNP